MEIFKFVSGNLEGLSCVVSKPIFASKSFIAGFLKSSTKFTLFCTAKTLDIQQISSTILVINRFKTVFCDLLVNLVVLLTGLMQIINLSDLQDILRISYVLEGGVSIFHFLHRNYSFEKKRNHPLLLIRQDSVFRIRTIGSPVVRARAVKK